MTYVYNSDGEFIECELLHEFLEAYQIQYVDSTTGEEVEKVVSRYDIKEVSSGRYDF